MLKIFGFDDKHKSDWCVVVQKSQDQGQSWKKSVEFADEICVNLK